ncbi:ATP-binding protein [Staphylococcus sciuri]|uniref:AAA family ATPase n=1 Tax=Mammaliicoccus sciuri TaxID=1296 RepID=UPI00066D4CA7|nr:ATP-binding protein [Mammaliicoccus sciuri]NGX76104.1 ATP-binding protein [Mammaliicoccus sciuri]
MYVEILKIIEAGLDSDRQKVLNYSNQLSKKLENEGNINISKKINRTIKSKNTRLSTLDSLTSKPLDKESRLDMVEVTVPTESDEVLFFEDIVETEVESFLYSVTKKEEFLKFGLSNANRLLIYGPPGTGKTSLASYISLQTNLPLVTVKLDALISSMLGSTAKNIRKVFDYSSRQPCVLFLDEFDVLAKIRDDKNELGELKRVVNSLLQNIDSFSSDSILIAATNHEGILDTAVWRRFNSVIHLDLPNFELRKKIIVEYSKILPTDYNDDRKKLNQLSLAMAGLSPADIKNIIQKVVKKAIITEVNTIFYSRLIYEIITSKNSSNISKDDVIFEMLKHKVTQREIAEVLSISLRQVRNYNNEVKKNE